MIGLALYPAGDLSPLTDAGHRISCRATREYPLRRPVGIGAEAQKLNRPAMLGGAKDQHDRPQLVQIPAGAPEWQRQELEQALHHLFVGLGGYDRSDLVEPGPVRIRQLPEECQVDFGSDRVKGLLEAVA